jgi:ribosomal protein L11 methyltransferase
MTEEARYPFVALDVPAKAADELSALLFELGASGVEERDDATLAKGPGAGTVTLVASFDSHDDARAAIDELASLGQAARLEEVVGDAWRDKYKEHFAPFSLGPHVTIAPPWDVVAPSREGERVLVLDPGRAFGTGLHATTSLLAGYLDEHRAELAGASVLDVGTGSGILALVALALGAERALGIDNDPDVLDVARENAARNGLGERLTVEGTPVERVREVFPLVLANIETRVLGPLADAIARRVAPGGRLLLSGILESEHEGLITNYQGRRLVHDETRRQGDAAGEAWIALAFRRER